MQSLNVLFVGDELSPAIKYLLQSKYLNKLYTSFEAEYSINLKFNTFKELAIKCKSLKIDVVFVEDKKYVYQGIADVLRSNFINCLTLTSNWSKLVLSNHYAQNLLNKHNILTPKILSYPSTFPLVVKTDGFSQTANNIAEVLDIKKYISQHLPQVEDKLHLEEFIDGKDLVLNSFFDGKHLVTISSIKLSEKIISDYNNKLLNMFLNEQANFIGYINSKMIYANQKLYNIGFDFDLPITKQDILFVAISIIYQKLNEIDITCK